MPAFENVGTLRVVGTQMIEWAVGQISQVRSVNLVSPQRFALDIEERILLGDRP